MNTDPPVVLLIEDNTAHAELVIHSLRDHRVASRIHHISDGKTALDYLFRRGDYVDPDKSPQPHLILLDLSLPGIGGLRILQKIKSTDQLRSIPVVILTTSESEEDVSNAYDYHANSYLVKQADFDGFSRLIGNVASYWLTCNRPGTSIKL